MREISKANIWPCYLSNVEAAKYLCLSPRTLEKTRVFGDGPRFHKFGAKVVYAIADLEAWAATRGRRQTEGSR